MSNSDTDTLTSMCLFLFPVIGRQILSVEIVVPWVFVGVLAVLLLLTTGLLVIVICKFRSRSRTKLVSSSNQT